MSDLQDIDDALSTGLASANSLLTWQRGSEAYEYVKRSIEIIKLGQRAAANLRNSIRDGKRYIETPDREFERECTCSTSPMPPCGFCESGGGEAEE